MVLVAAALPQDSTPSITAGRIRTETPRSSPAGRAPSATTRRASSVSMIMIPVEARE